MPAVPIALSIPFAAKFLPEVIEVLGFCVVPREDLVGIGQSDDFLLHKGSKSGFDRVFVDRWHDAVALASAETFQFVYYFRAGVLPGRVYLRNVSQIP